MSTSRHCVSVRFSAEEMERVDRLRGRVPRGTWCRKAVLGRPIPVIPEPCRTAYAETARWASALSQIAYHLNRGEVPEVEEIRKELSGFRRSLLGLREEGKKS
jgi:hypothetical protein